jgi:hypothetical protein
MIKEAAKLGTLAEAPILMCTHPPLAAYRSSCLAALWMPTTPPQGTERASSCNTSSCMPCSCTLLPGHHTAVAVRVCTRVTRQNSSWYNTYTLLPGSSSAQQPSPHCKHAPQQLPHSFLQLPCRAAADIHNQLHMNHNTGHHHAPLTCTPSSKLPQFMYPPAADLLPQVSTNHLHTLPSRASSEHAIALTTLMS